MSKTNIDFAEWAELASSDPEAFEKQRARLVESFICSVPTESRRIRLRRLQWKIDAIRQRSKSSLGACIKISNLMWESIYGKGGLMELLNGNIPLEKQPVTEKAPCKTSNVIPFRTR